MTIVPRFLNGILCGLLFLVLLAGCGGGGGGVLPVFLTSIEVTPAQPSIALGTTVQFTATGIFSDHSKKDLTSSVSWSSSTPATATVGAASGLATSVAAGQTTITAALGGVSGKATLTVTNATLVSIGVTPTNPSIALGTSQQFIATGVFSDTTVQDLTTQVAWDSSATAVASIGNTGSSKGLAVSVAAGATTITATSGAVHGNTTLTVTPATLQSIQVTPTNPTLPLGRSQQFTATGLYSDHSNQDVTSAVTWDSSNKGVATISTAGNASSVATGTTTITATLGSTSGSTVLTITPAILVAIDIDQAPLSIALGTSQQFTATGTYSDNTTNDLTKVVVWSSSSTGVATISNAPGSEGLATSVAAGVTTITATSGSLSGSTDLTVDPATLVSIDVAPTTASIPLGLTEQFFATGIYSDGTSQDVTASVTWSSTNTGAATISNAPGTNGLATTVAPGSTTITATIGIISGSTTLTVTSATLASIAVTPAPAQIAIGTTLQFTATGTYSDATTQDLTTFVTWNSSAGAVAAISNAGVTRGLATSTGVGSTTITATLGSIVSNNATLAVTAATLSSITVTPGNSTMSLGDSRQFTATGTFSDSTVQDLTTQVTWKSSNKTIAVISNAFGSKGLATPIRAGSTTISATFTFAGVTGSTTLNVTTSSLTGITITPANPTLSVGRTLQFTATGTYADGHTQDLTTSVNLTWTSSNRTFATIVNVPKKSKGLATGVSPGSVTIRASDRKGVIVGTTTLTVI